MNYKELTDKLTTYDKERLLTMFNEWRAYLKSLNLDLNLHRANPIDDEIKSMIEFEDTLEDTIEDLPDFNQVLSFLIQKDIARGRTRKNKSKCQLLLEQKLKENKL